MIKWRCVDYRTWTDALEAKDKEIERLKASRDSWRKQYTDTYTAAAETNKRLRAVVDAAILWSESDAPSVERALLDAIVDYEAALWAEGDDE